MAAELIQIYYHESQKEFIYPFAKPFFNNDLTIFFENSVIKDLVMQSKAEKIGVCSWKLTQKLRWNIGKPQLKEHITEEVINSEYDVLPFTRNSKHHTMLGAAENWHPNFRSTLAKILEKLGISMPEEVKIPIYQNAFMAKLEIYQDYVKSYLSPAMDMIQNDPEIYLDAVVDSNYTALAKKDAADSDYLEQKIGLRYYPLAPFLLERLFSIYIHNKKINVTWLH
ncbi:MAG TPA: hypothetical protein VFU05_07870 [Cyclobacteriaceae bacterium]|nr:hypothetical protein [Cyclobacteriaceae bacterium]